MNALKNFNFSSLKKNFFIKNNIFYLLIKMKEDNDYDINSDNEEYIFETKYGDSVEIEETIKKKLLKKAEKAICKINVNDEIGTGFFYKIPFNNNKNIIKDLFTNNHVLNKESLKIEKLLI